jgi:hypothetical protein
MKKKNKHQMLQLTKKEGFCVRSGKMEWKMYNIRTLKRNNA